MEHAVELGSQGRRLTVEDIKDIHRTLLRFSIDRDIAGKLRTTQGWIGGSEFNPRDARFVPPPATYVPGFMQDLCSFVNRDDLPEIVQAAIAHAQFETIHPFADGNGRVGRALIHVILKRRGMASRYVSPISLVLAAQRRTYIAGLMEYREGDINDWVSFFADATRDSAAEANRLAGQIEELGFDWIERLGRPRSDAAVRQIITVLTAYPVIDSGIATRVTGKSAVAATNALNQLEQAEVLAKVNDKKWGRVWECPELFDLITRFERELAGE
jgi:Fic family protein